jgi:hypothetical protein
MAVRTLPRDPPGEGGPRTTIKIILNTARTMLRNSDYCCCFILVFFVFLLLVPVWALLHRLKTPHPMPFPAKVGVCFRTQNRTQNRTGPTKPDPKPDRPDKTGPKTGPVRQNRSPSPTSPPPLLRRMWLYGRSVAPWLYGRSVAPWLYGRSVAPWDEMGGRPVLSDRSGFGFGFGSLLPYVTH